MSPEESSIVVAAMDEGLSLMQPSDAAVRRELLEGEVLSALDQAPAAQLWACCLEVAERGLTSAAEVAEALVGACSSIASVVFADALGL